MPSSGSSVTISCQPTQRLVNNHPAAHPPLLAQALGATELLHRGEGDDDRDIDEDFDKWCAHMRGFTLGSSACSSHVGGGAMYTCSL